MSHLLCSPPQGSLFARLARQRFHGASEAQNLRELTLGVLDEVERGDRGVGGKGFTTGEVKALA